MSDEEDSPEECSEESSDEAPTVSARNSKKWESLQWRGLIFAPPYEPHGKPLLYGPPRKKKRVELSPEEEEPCTWYAQAMGTNYVEKDTFNRNFFACWRKLLGKENKAIIKKFEFCDFSLMYNWVQDEKERKKNLPKEEKKEKKRLKDEFEAPYKFALVDGKEEKLGNFHTEPPSLFRGRGEHPKMGMIKARVEAEDVTVNCGKSDTPPAPPEGHKWKAIKHDNSKLWVASWTCNVTNDTKYVLFAPTSRLRQKPDIDKYEKARKLKTIVDDVRRNYYSDMAETRLDRIRQIGTAVYLIDKLALRAGGEKDDEEADTVGCCSLRCEHMTLEEGNILKLDFLGKDSIRYQNSVEIEDLPFRNLKSFLERKKPSDQVFDLLSSSSVNARLKKLMPGLTAKVFRTYNASHTLNEQLRDKNQDLFTASLVALKEADPKMEEPALHERVAFYNRANKNVAILCNHQRTISKTYGTQMSKMVEKELAIKAELSALNDHIEKLENGDIPQTGVKNITSSAKTKKRATAKTKKRAIEKKATKKKAKKKAESSDDEDYSDDDVPLSKLVSRKKKAPVATSTTTTTTATPIRKKASMKPRVKDEDIEDEGDLLPISSLLKQKETERKVKDEVKDEVKKKTWKRSKGEPSDEDPMDVDNIPISSPARSTRKTSESESESESDEEYSDDDDMPLSKVMKRSKVQGWRQRKKAKIDG